MFKRILVALDGSENAWRALEGAIHIAKTCDGAVTLIHVYPPVTARPMLIPEPSTITPPALPPATTTEITKAIEAARKTGSDILAKGKQRAEEMQVSAATVLVEGRAAEEIVRVAREEGFELVVMGARGISKLKEILLGSVSHDVVRRAPCPVLIVK